MDKQEERTYITQFRKLTKSMSVKLQWSAHSILALHDMATCPERALDLTRIPFKHTAHTHVCARVRTHIHTQKDKCKHKGTHTHTRRLTDECGHTHMLIRSLEQNKDTDTILCKNKTKKGRQKSVS